MFDHDPLLFMRWDVDIVALEQMDSQSAVLRVSAGTEVTGEITSTSALVSQMPD